MVLASAHRLRPCSVFGPVLSPPWFLQTSLPLIAGALHWSRVRLLVALHCLHSIRSPQVINVRFVDMFYILFEGSREGVLANYAQDQMNRLLMVLWVPPLYFLHLFIGFI
jgi:hypothetical protein